MGRVWALRVVESKIERQGGCLFYRLGLMLRKKTLAMRRNDDFVTDRGEEEPGMRRRRMVLAVLGVVSFCSDVDNNINQPRRRCVDLGSIPQGYISPFHFS